MAGIFKAYDVRGIVPGQLNQDIAQRIGRAFSALLDGSPAERPNTVIVGRDMRSHSPGICDALIDGLLSSGLDVFDCGLCTTPFNYFAVGHLGTAGGVQVTASHNAAEYNGLKFSLHGARPVSGESGIPEMERRVQQNDLPATKTPGQHQQIDLWKEYGDHLLPFLEHTDRPLKVVVDAANGMGSMYRELLEKSGIELIPLYFELDGSFPNHEANPLNLENLADLCQKVQATGADLGVSFDGDADRAAFVDQKGIPVGSDIMTALIAGRLLTHRKGAVVYDIRSSRSVAEFITRAGGDPVLERVGHSFIKATMRQLDAVFGGELAGHYYFRENYFADSSLLAVFQVLNLLRDEQKPFSEVTAPLLTYAKSPEINFEIEDKQAAMDELVRLYAHDGGGELDTLDGIRIDFPDWWFNVRPSNTEPLLRLVLEATTEELLDEKQRELVEFLRGIG